MILISVKFKYKDIINVIRLLHVNKAHGHDNIFFYYRTFLAAASIKVCFLISWKKSNIYPFDKKDDKLIIKNYRPISLLPICEKSFERLIFNPFYEYIEETKVLSDHHPYFRSNYSYVYELLSIISKYF